MNVLREQVRSTGETAEHERSAADMQLASLRDDLARTKEALAEAQRREAQLHSFR